MARPSQALQAEVRRRAGGRCEYCLFPEAAAELPFHLDHIIAQKHRGQRICELGVGVLFLQPAEGTEHRRKGPRE